jgi:hypothetical protein
MHKDWNNQEEKFALEDLDVSKATIKMMKLPKKP